jgi:hypothetical protein
MSKGADKDDRRRQMLAGAHSAVTVNSSACGSTSYLVIDQKTQAVVAVARGQAVMVPCCHVAKLMSEKNERAPRGLSDSSESIQSLPFWDF